MRNGTIFRWASLAVVVLGMTSGLPVRGHAEDVDARSFFPWEKGDSWVYDTLDKKSKTHFEMNVEIEDSWKDGDQSGMIMTQRDKRGQMKEFQTRNEKGIFITKLELKKPIGPHVTSVFNPAVPRVIFPFKEGSTVHWEGRFKVAWIDKPIIFDGKVEGWEDVTVPAGTFHCVKLYYHQKRGDDMVDEYAWYADKVGQVKYDGGQYVKELKSYKVN